MEKAIQSGKWFQIKKDGIKYNCMITLKFNLVRKHEIKIEKYFWFKKPFVGAHSLVGGDYAFLRGGEFWYSPETAKELFDKAYNRITNNKITSERIKKERSKISHQNIIE